MKHKRGSLDLNNNLVFYRYQESKEVWMTSEAFSRRIKKDKEIAEKRKALFNNREHREVGEINKSTGLVFWRYNKNCKNGEWWVTPNQYEELKIKSLDSVKKWQSKNPEKAKDILRDWRRNNKAQMLTHVRTRTSLKKKALHPEHNKQFEVCLTECCKRLENCLGNAWEVDHIIPLSKGGKHHHSNLQILPAYWNRKKYNKQDFELPDCFITV
jgi:5-methylcytosine-specific restriction endonuclease McrA